MYAKLDKLMKEKGVTPYRVSKDTGIAQSTLSDWKKQKFNPKFDKLVRLSKYFGVPITYFINDFMQEEQTVGHKVHRGD